MIYSDSVRAVFKFASFVRFRGAHRHIGSTPNFLRSVAHATRIRKYEVLGERHTPGAGAAGRGGARAVDCGEGTARRSVCMAASARGKVFCFVPAL